VRNSIKMALVLCVAVVLVIMFLVIFPPGIVAGFFLLYAAYRWGGWIKGSRSTLSVEDSTLFACYNKGLSLANSGRYAEAIGCYDKALEIDPQFAKAWVNKGATLILLKRHQEALQCFDKALAIDPKNEYAQQLKRSMSSASK